MSKPGMVREPCGRSAVGVSRSIFVFVFGGVGCWVCVFVRVVGLRDSHLLRALGLN